MLKLLPFEGLAIYDLCLRGEGMISSATTRNWRWPAESYLCRLVLTPSLWGFHASLSATLEILLSNESSSCTPPRVGHLPS